MAEISRNAPCPCGSGKKYKHCCINKKEVCPHCGSTHEHDEYEYEDEDEYGYDDEYEDDDDDEYGYDDEYEDDEEEDEEEEGKIELSDEEEEAFWDNFHETDYEHKISIFLEKLDDKAFIDDEFCFEMLNTIREEALDSNDWGRVPKLISTLKEKLPKIYKKSCGFYLEWQIEDAIAQKQWDLLEPLVMGISEVAYKNVYEFERVCELLGYYGQIQLLIKATKSAWQTFKERRPIVPFDIESLSDDGALSLIFDCLESSSASSIDEADLLQKINYFGDFDSKWLHDYLIHIRGQANRKWSLNDFALPSDNKKGGKEKYGEEEFTPGEDNLYNFSTEFLGYLRRVRNVPYTKAETAREHILEYILERHEGDLDHGEGLMEEPRKKHGKHKRRKKVSDGIENMLCPDRETFSRYISRFFEIFLGGNVRISASLFEMIPAWLDFLELHKLLDHEKHREAINSLRTLKKHILEGLEIEVDFENLKVQIEKNWGG